MTEGENSQKNRIFLSSLLTGRSIEQEFDLFCRRIVTRYDDLKRRHSEPNAGAEAANQWLRQTVYRCFLPLLESGQEEELRALCSLQESKAKNRKRGSGGRDTIFNVAIRAIFAHDMTAIGDHSRRRVAASLWWAFRHFVSADALEGFLARFPNETIEKHSRSPKVDYREMEWVIICLAEATDGADRGPYTKSIQRYVERYRNALESRSVTRAGPIVADEDWEDWEDNETEEDDRDWVDEDG